MANKNVSDSEKTIKSMLSVMGSDNYTIDKLIEYTRYGDDGNIMMLSLFLDNYQDYFSQYLVSVEVPEKYYYQPAYFSEMYYGTPGLDWLVLYFAGMTSLFEFKKPKIKILPKNRILELTKLMAAKAYEVSDSYNFPQEHLAPVD